MNRYLLDTHTFLWVAADPANLSVKVAGIVRNRENQLFLSAASGWEIAMLQHLNRISLPDEPQRFIAEAMHELDITPLPIGLTAAINAAGLPFHHRDPFDRILIAEALKENMIILTKDKVFGTYAASIAW